MIEVDTVVECNSKEKANLEKFKRLQNITYLSNETIRPPPVNTNKPCKYGEDCKLKGISCKYLHPINAKAGLTKKAMSIIYDC